MPLFAVHNSKHAIWLSNYDFLKRILKEPQNTGYKVIVMKTIYYFFNEYLSSWAHKILPIKVLSNPQNIIRVSLQVEQYTFKI